MKNANARTAIRLRVALDSVIRERASVYSRALSPRPVGRMGGWLDGDGVRVFLYLIIILGRGSEAIA